MAGDAELESEAEADQAWGLEAALDHVGVGRFQWVALAVCGLANAADAVEILGLSLVIPAAEDDLQLTASGKSVLSSSIFLGMLLGGLIWGPLGDALGRRRTLALSLAINAAFGTLSAASRGVGDLVFMRLIGGIGVGGSVPVVFSFLAELLPASARGKFMVGLAAHWMVGSIFSAGTGWAMIPTVGWRAFLVVAALPAWLAAAGTMLLLPESPRYLLVQGRVEEAEQVIRRMAAVNRLRLPPNMHLQHHESHLLAHNTATDNNSDGKYTTELSQLQKSGSNGNATVAAPVAGSITSITSSTTRQWVQRARRALRDAAVSASQLTRPPLRSRLIPLLIAWIGMCGGWYSTVLWIPEYFKARGAGNSSIYAESFAVAAANLPGNIASVYMVDRLGRRLTACICLAGACAAALCFAAAPADPVWSVVAACVFNAISVGGWNALDLLSAELFPTEVRSTAMGLLGATGRLASFTTTYLAGALMGLKLWAPLVVAAGLLAAGSVAMMVVPEMALKPLEDTVEDAAEGSTACKAATSVRTGLGKGLHLSRSVLSRDLAVGEKQRWSHGTSLFIIGDGNGGIGNGGTAGLAERQYHSAPGQGGDLQLHHLGTATSGSDLLWHDGGTSRRNGDVL